MLYGSKEAVVIAFCGMGNQDTKSPVKEGERLRFDTHALPHKACVPSTAVQGSAPCPSSLLFRGFPLWFSSNEPD